MSSLGSALLGLAFLAALAAGGLALAGRNGDECLLTLSRRTVYGFCGLITACVVIIELAFAGDDFSFQIVQEHSSIETPSGYKLAAMWSSQEGSLLLWAFVLSLASSAALWATRRRLRDLVPWATAVMMGVAAFFTGLMLFAPDVDPFATLSPAPPNGVGLNPLLQHPSMMIHPPMLYSGYVAFTVPFAFAIGALVTRRLDAEWIRATRRFALIAWAFLGLGLLLGARWSYTELGWGGYWAWDPVENAALMPWLLGTAFLHSIMVQEKRGMLKVWNASLIVGTFSMALLGTFLVRSGVLQSIHAFGDNTVGPYILGLIGVVLVGSTALIVSRLDDLRSPKRIDSLASRESVFLVNNLLLVGMTAVIFWGTFFPLISELFTGEKASLAAPWFDRYTTPLAIGLVVFTGIGPLLAWRRVSWESAKRVFRVPAAVGGVIDARAGRFHRRRRTTSGRWRSSPSPPSPSPAWRRSSGAAPPRAAAHRRARRPGAGRPRQPQPPSLRRLHRPRRRHRPADRNRRLLQLPDQPRCRAATGGEHRRRRPHYHLREADRLGRSGEARLRRPAPRRRRRRGIHLLRPSRQFFRPTGQETGTISTYFAGEATSEVGLRAGLGHDLWIAEQPNVAGVQRGVRLADKGFTACVRGAPGTPPQCKVLAGADARGGRQPEPAAPGSSADHQAPGAGGRTGRQQLPADDCTVDLQGDRQPARHLDVDRRHHRPGRRTDRPLALARPPPRRPRPHRSRRPQGSQVPRDSRRRARPRRRQALRRGLRGPRRRAARGGAGDPRRDWTGTDTATANGDGNGAHPREPEKAERS